VSPGPSRAKLQRVHGSQDAPRKKMLLLGVVNFPGKTIPFHAARSIEDHDLVDCKGLLLLLLRRVN
jgi:hypothetical protein